MEGCINPPTTLDLDDLTTVSMIMGEENFFFSLNKEPALVLKKGAIKPTLLLIL